MKENDDGYLRDSEIALMDTIKTAFELMMTAGLTPAQIDKLLAGRVARSRRIDAVTVARQCRLFFCHRCVLTVTVLPLLLR